MYYWIKVLTFADEPLQRPDGRKSKTKVLRIYRVCNSGLDASVMKNGENSFFNRALSMYVDGFRSMTVGRKLWALILIKLAIMFLVFRLFFFPDILHENYDTDAQRAQAVRSALASGNEN